MGALEILALTAIIGGVLGLFFRSKSTKAWIGFALGAIGAAVIAWLFASFVFQSILAIPVYGIFGSWMFIYIYQKIAK